MIIEILFAVSVILNIFLLYKQIPIWRAYHKEVQFDKEIEEEIKEIESTTPIIRIKEEIIESFNKLKQVKTIHFHGNRDHFGVVTLLKSRHYNSRQCLYEKQLQIHDMFPGVNIEFNIIFKPKDKDGKCMLSMDDLI